MSQTDSANTKQDSWGMVLLSAARDISLSESFYETIAKRYQFLKGILDASDDPLLAGAHIFVQGSIGLKTAIKPSTNANSDDLKTVDADAVVLLPNAISATAQEVLDAIKKRFDAGARTSAPIEELRRGIRVVYADEDPGFHIDVTPARVVPGNDNTEGYGNLQVPDRTLQDWKCSTPRDYSKWLEDTAAKQINVMFALEERQRHKTMTFDAATQDPLPDYEEYTSSKVLQAVIKLLKRHRDEWAIHNKSQRDYRPISAVITTLATHAYAHIGERSVSSPLKPLDAILSIIDSMANFIKHDESSEPFKIFNPRDNGENFAEKWNRPNGEGKKYREAFNSWHASVKNDFRLGLQSLNESAYKEKFRESFGLREAFINRAEDSLPRNWILPGRHGNETGNTQLLAAVTGGFGAGKTMLQEITPPEELG